MEKLYFNFGKTLLRKLHNYEFKMDIQFGSIYSSEQNY